MGRVGCLVAVAAISLVAACGPAPTPTFRVQGAGESITLPAWTFCVDRMCADGAPPEDPPEVDADDRVRVRFSEPGWTLTAAFRTPDADCSREFAVSLTPADDGGWTLDGAGPAGTYDVTLTARGVRGGDAHASFTWTTAHRGAMPAPQADLLTDLVELHVRHLDRTPAQGRATVTVTAADGTVTTVHPAPERHEGAPCRLTGRLSFYASRARTDLGPPPLRYDVRLELDGRTYRAAATAPSDVREDNGHREVALTFEPPLPAYTG